jgi:hypothetical protein
MRVGNRELCLQLCIVRKPFARILLLDKLRTVEFLYMIYAKNGVQMAFAHRASRASA